jgi:peptide/nickel transport system substrate-binding protein
VLAVALTVASASACSDLTKQDNYVSPDNGRPDPILRASKRRGGDLRLATSGEWPSMDPALVVQPEARNFLRNYARTLTVFRSAPADHDNPNGPALVVPDLAASLGAASNNATRWTYTLRDGIRYEDGTPVSAADIAYAVMRSQDRALFPEAPDWFAGALKSATATNDRTVVFDLTRSVPNFDDYAQLPVTAPVPRSKDSAAYGNHVLSSGPYKFGEVVPGRRYSLVRNDQYDPNTDPLSLRGALPDTITVEAGIEQTELSRRVRNGELHMQIGSPNGPGSAIAGRVIGDPQPKDPVVTAALPTIAYTLINPVVEPLTDQLCRLAVLRAADRDSYARAYGGPVVARVATGLLPPAGVVPRVETRLDHAPAGDVTAANAELKGCKAPNGFTATLAYREGRADEASAAEALKTSLARIHIALELKAFPASGYYTEYAGNPAYAAAHHIGLIMSDSVAPRPGTDELLRPIVDGSDTGRAANVDMRYLAEVQALLKDPTHSTNALVRREAWTHIDALAMQSAYVIPGAWGQNTLFQPTRVTNLFVNDGFGTFDYTRLGTVRQ